MAVPDSPAAERPEGARRSPDDEERDGEGTGGPATRGSGLAALRHGDFRLFRLGEVVSLVGTWMQGVALSWMVLDITRSPLARGAVISLTAGTVAFWVSPPRGQPKVAVLEEIETTAQAEAKKAA